MNWDRLRLQAFACLFFLLCLFDRNVGQEEESKTGINARVVVLNDYF